MSQALANRLDEDERLRVARAIALPDPEALPLAPKLEDAAFMLGITPGDLATLLNDPSFLKLLRGLTRAQATLSLHTSGVSSLVKIMDTGDNKEKLTAFKLLGTMTGDLRTQHQVDVKVTFDELRRRADTPTPDPLASLFEVHTGEIIDVTEDEDE